MNSVFICDTLFEIVIHLYLQVALIALVSVIIVCYTCACLLFTEFYQLFAIGKP